MLKTISMSFHDHFSHGAADYAEARPTYPPALFALLADLAPGRSAAWDCGTGNGQAARGLAEFFEIVYATDPSQQQIERASLHPRIRYARSAETAPFLADESLDLVTAAQAAHWFDRDLFYHEAKRVLRPRGWIAIWCYELCLIDPAIDALLRSFYIDALAPFWPPERAHVETAYRELDFPFAERPFPGLFMEHDWSLEQFTGYLRTWSAVKRCQEASGIDPVHGPRGIHDRLQVHWTGRRRVRWPLSGRMGQRPP